MSEFEVLSVIRKLTWKLSCTSILGKTWVPRPKWKSIKRTRT